MGFRRTTVINSMLSHIQQLYNHSAVPLNFTHTGAEFGWLTVRTMLTVSHLASLNVVLFLVTFLNIVATLPAVRLNDDCRFADDQLYSVLPGSSLLAVNPQWSSSPYPSAWPP